MIAWKELEKEIVMRGEKLNLVENIDKIAKYEGDKLALSFEDDSGVRELSYSELLKGANKFANYLDKLGVKKQSRVFIFLPKCPEMYISIIGTIKQGSIAAPLFEAFQTDGLELRLDRGESQVLITNKELLERLKNKKLAGKIIIIENDWKKIEKEKEDYSAYLLNKQDTSMMIFTSSTAGTPVAGIMIPHYGIIQQVYTGRVVLELNENSRYWCTAHPGWVTGSIYGVLVPFCIGASVYVLEGRFSSKWIEFMKKNRIEVVYTAPTVLRLMKPEIKKEDLTYLKNVCSVGEALHRETFDFYKKLGVRINDTYWQTETGAIVIANYGKFKKDGALGAGVGVNISVKDGEIVIEKPFPAMMTSIYKHEAMYKTYFKDNLFLCHDLATFKDGFFYFEGRKDDIIKTRGERVSPLEIESAVMKHKDVKEAAVIGIPDEELGAKIKAFVVLKDEVKASEEKKQEIMMFVKNNYAGHAYPKIIEFIDKLPKTNSGKIIRAKLRELEKA